MKLSFIKWITDNLGLKLVSLFLTIVLWFYVAGEENIEITRKVPLKIEPPSKEITILNSSLQTLDVTLKFPRNLLSKASSAEISAFHRIKNVDKAGEYKFEVEPKDILLPPGNIYISSIQPAVVAVNLDELVTQKLPVKPDIVGEPPLGYSIDATRIEIDPKEVLIEGPKSKIKKLKWVKTELIDVVDRSGSFKKKAKIFLDPDLRLVDKNMLVNVSIPLKEEFSTQEFSAIPVSVLGAAKENLFVNLDPLVIKLNLSGPKIVLEKMGVKDILAFVNITGLKSGEYELPLDFKLPPNVSPYGEVPSVKVKLEEIKKPI